MRLLDLRVIMFSLLFSIVPSYLAAQNLISGTVQCLGVGVESVVVTDGYQCVQTDHKGKYTLLLHPQAQFVYITSPANYLPPVKESVPQFYLKIDKSTDTYDFMLSENLHNDNSHMFVVQADVQMSSEEHVVGYIDYLDKLKLYLDTTAKKRDVFVLDCGDIIGNTPSIFPAYVKESSKLELPVYRSIGNHDMEYGVRSHEHSYKTYESYFGPIYYSFNRGKAHYVVLNNCFYVNRHYQYIGYINEQTLQWLEKDLSYVPKDHLVFVTMHIPSSSTKELKFNTLLPDETSNASSLFDLLDGYDAHILTGHTHNNGNVVFNNRLMEHNTAAVCGTFWKANLCTDGTPSGCGVYEVDGNNVTWKYKSSDFPIDYQFRSYAIGVSEDDPEYFLANIWNWDEQWSVQWYENGKYMGEMERFVGYDPEAKAICSDKERVEYDWISPITTDHMFRAIPKERNAMIEIKVTDRFGNVYTQSLSK